MRCAKCCSTAVLCSAASKSSNFLHLDVLDGLFESGQQRRHVARQLAEAIPVLPCHVLQKVKSVFSMIFDSAVDACGRVAPAERLLLPVLLAYALLRGLRCITDAIIARLRRLWLHLASAKPRSKNKNAGSWPVRVCLKCKTFRLTLLLY
jgi:hypothetical protein